MMSLPVRHIKAVENAEPNGSAPRINRRAKAEFDSHMAMIRHLVDEAENRETGEYLFRGMMQQCKILAKRYELRVE